MLKILVFIIYALTSCLGLYFLKISNLKILTIEFMSGGILYGIGFLIWLYILKNNSLSLAFPIASGMLIIVTQVIGTCLLKENISLNNVIGSLFLIIGICIIYIKR